MIILMPEKSFKKRIEKWVTYKDFFIADSLDRHDGMMREYGNRIDCDELSPTPSLILIATEGDTNKEAAIKRRRLNTYLDAWLNDEAVNIKLHYLVGLILRNYNATGEDTNVFVVMRNPIYYAYHEALQTHINEEFQCEVCTSVTHKMEKPTIKAILSKHLDKGFFKTLRQAWKRVGKAYKIKPEESIHIDEYNELY